MPRCACASEVYGSVFVSVCLSVCISSASIVIFYLVLEFYLVLLRMPLQPFRKVRSKTCPWSVATATLLSSYASRRRGYGKADCVCVCVFQL